MKPTSRQRCGLSPAAPATAASSSHRASHMGRARGVLQSMPVSQRGATSGPRAALQHQHISQEATLAARRAHVQSCEMSTAPNGVQTAQTEAQIQGAAGDSCGRGESPARQPRPSRVWEAVWCFPRTEDCPNMCVGKYPHQASSCEGSIFFPEMNFSFFGVKGILFPVILFFSE